jgi:hypothetical protein
LCVGFDGDDAIHEMPGYDCPDSGKDSKGTKERPLSLTSRELCHALDQEDDASGDSEPPHSLKSPGISLELLKTLTSIRHL